MSATNHQRRRKTGPLGDKESLREVLDFAALTRWEGGSMRSSPPCPPSGRPGRMRSPRPPSTLRGEYADYVHGTTLTSTADGSPCDRHVLSGGSTALLRATGAGRIVGSVTTASGATLRTPELLKETRQWKKPNSRCA